MNNPADTNDKSEIYRQTGKKLIDIATGKNSVVFVLEDGATILIRGNLAGGLTITSAMQQSELNSMHKSVNNG